MPRTEHDADPTAAWGSTGPGGPWILRIDGEGSHMKPAAKQILKPPENEASAVAWKASRKQTLHGNLGTGNKISSVIQYPVSTRDPFNNFTATASHLSAEDRRLLRVMVKHYLRDLRGTNAFADGVYLVENQLLKGFRDSPTLRVAFYTNEAVADKLLKEAAGLCQGKVLPPEPQLAKCSVYPGHHGPFCGPQCFCLRHQDTALGVTVTDKKPEEWKVSFRDKTNAASKAVVHSLIGANETLKLSKTSSAPLLGRGR